MKALVVAVVAIALGCGFGYGLSLYVGGESTGFDVLQPLGVAEIDPWLVPAAGDQQPRLVIDNEVADLGVLPLDATVSHTFRISNEGTAPLHLRADGIIYMEYEHKLQKNNLSPGESTTLSISWTPESDNIGGKWTSMESAGAFARMVSLSSNDPQAPRKLLAVEGIHVPPVVMEQETFDLGMCDPATERVLETRVYSYHTDALEIASPAMGNAELRHLFDVSTSPLTPEELASVPEVEGLKPKSGYDVAVTVKPGLPMGEFLQQIRLPMRPQSKMKLVLNIAGETPSDLRLGGKAWHRGLEAINMGGVLSADGASREFAVYFTGEYRDQINLQFVSATPDSLQVELLEPEHSSDGLTTIYPMRIIVPPNAKPAEFAGPVAGGEFGEIRFRTDHPRLPEFDVQVLITILQ